MIIDYRQPPADAPGMCPTRFRLADKTTGLELPVFYYDSRTHILGRYATDFDGALLLCQGDPTKPASEGLVEIWEWREMTVSAAAEKRAATGPTTVRILSPDGVRLTRTTGVPPQSPAGVLTHVGLPRVQGRPSMLVQGFTAEEPS